VAKKGCLGCSFPVLIGVVVLLVLVVTSILAGPIGQSVATKFNLDFNLPDWVAVDRPHPELPAETVFHILGFPVSNSLIASWLTMIVLVAGSWAIMRRVSMVPGRLQTAFEYVVGGLYSFCQSVAGEERGRRFFPVVSTIFLFVMFNAWLGLLPGFGSIVVHSHGHVIHLLRPANTDINTPLALALVSFVFVLYFGLKDLRFKFLQQYFDLAPMFKAVGQLFTGKVKAGLGGLFTGFIMFFVSILELLSMFIRIVSFTFRLFGNMTAGEILLLMVVFLVPYVIGVVFYGLELLVGFVQALIFGGLTLVFLTLATTAHGDEGH